MQRILFTSMAILVFCLTGTGTLQGADKKDSLIFHKIITQLSVHKEATTAQRILKAAKLLLETPYVAGTLEQEPEQLIINLHETDCILFVETCLALAITSKEPQPSFDKYEQTIRKLRYRKGVIDGYTSRLHYTSEWILQGEQNGLFKEVSREIASTPFNKEFYFMSTHPQAYKQLANSPTEVEKIKQIEKELSRYNYFYLPKTEVAQYAGLIKEGDMIGFCTSIAGLDMTHVGIAYRDKGKLTFIHASGTGKKVLIESKSLVEYILQIKSNSGIRIIRPL